MHIKKNLIFLFCLVFLSAIVMAQDYKLEISTTQDSFKAEENITFKVTVYDSQNNPVYDEIQIMIEDAEKKVKVEKIISSNELMEIGLKGASYGQGKITATYKDSTATGFFNIEINELVKFEIQGEKLIITNIGNTKYTKTVQIIIGETTGIIKEPKLNIGESVSYILIAPEGTYNIKVSDGKTSINQGEIKLTGTGKVIGALDERASSGAGITGISPEADSETELLGYVKKSKFIYVFVLTIFGAMILLAIERRYRRKAD
ncbi:MAG: hypothetical protein KJ646_01560 [Nanoarchaeota archaeon]|nr:hypothetical protein [Nanoarchaeota archaeon]